jgi:hypothetical protein
VFVKPTRVGGTTAGQILLGYWIDNDPGPCLTVMPSEAAVEQEIKERVRPMLEACPSLPAHVSPRPHDNTLSVIKLDTMTLYFGWAGSPQSLASNTCRYVRFDEVDKYPAVRRARGRPDQPRQGAHGDVRAPQAPLHHQHADDAGGCDLAGVGVVRRQAPVPRPLPALRHVQVLAWPQVKWPKLPIADKVKLADEIERAGWRGTSAATPTARADRGKPQAQDARAWRVGQRGADGDIGRDG